MADMPVSSRHRRNPPSSVVERWRALEKRIRVERAGQNVIATDAECDAFKCAGRDRYARWTRLLAAVLVAVEPADGDRGPGHLDRPAGRRRTGSEEGCHEQHEAQAPVHGTSITRPSRSPSIPLADHDRASGRHLEMRAVLADVTAQPEHHMREADGGAVLGRHDAGFSTVVANEREGYRTHLF
jgi:hypothetical protein